MRHVDNAHQPIGNGQAQGGQQQHRAKADAAERCAQALAPSQIFSNVCQRRFDGFLHGRIRFIGQALVEQQLCLWRLRMGQLLNGLKTLLPVIAIQQASGFGAAQQGFDLFIGFAG